MEFFLLHFLALALYPKQYFNEENLQNNLQIP